MPAAFCRRGLLLLGCTVVNIFESICSAECMFHFAHVCKWIMEENIFTAGVAGVRSLTEIFSTAGYMQVMHLAPRCKPPVVRTHGRKLQIPVVTTTAAPPWERPEDSCSAGHPSPGKRCKKLLDTAESPEPLCRCGPSVQLSVCYGDLIIPCTARKIF